MAGVWAPCLLGCVLYIYITPYNISTYFIGQKETGVLPERDNPCIFHKNIRNTLRPFVKGHILQCLLCIGTVPRPVVTFSVATLSICLCIHTTTILTLWRTLTLYYLRPSLLNFTLIKYELSCSSSVNLDYPIEKKTLDWVELIMYTFHWPYSHGGHFVLT